MISVLVLDRDPFYGKCVEKTISSVNRSDIHYLGQVFTKKSLEEYVSRELIDILIVSDEFYQYPRTISNFCRLIIVTSMNINYTPPRPEDVPVTLLAKPFSIEEFTDAIVASADAISRSTAESSRISGDKIDIIIGHIKSHISDELTLDTLSALVHYSPSYCSKCFKDHTGMSLSDFIRDIRIKRAETLLATTDYQIQEIAEMVGIPKVNTFGTIFRSKHGVSPRVYRSRL